MASKTKIKSDCQYCGDPHPIGPGLSAHERFCGENPDRASNLKARAKRTHTKKRETEAGGASNLALLALTAYPNGLPTDPVELSTALDWVVRTDRILERNGGSTNGHRPGRRRAV